MEPASVKAVSLYMEQPERQNETILVVDGDIITRTVMRITSDIVVTVFSKHMTHLKLSKPCCTKNLTSI
jgi:hypothetical protein